MQTLISVAFLLFLAISVPSCSHADEDHDHGPLTSRNVIEEINESLAYNNTALSKENLQQLLNQIGFQNCSATSPAICSLCTPIDVLLTRHRLSTDAGALLSRQQFLNLLPSLVFLLGAKESGVQNLGAVCNTSSIEFPLSDNTTAFHGVASQHGGRQNDTLISEAVLDSLLDTLNNTVGHLLNSSGQCYDVDDVFKGTNISESNVTAENFELVSAFIILKVLRRNCITEHHATATTLPTKTAFIDSIFAEFASNGTMSLDNFEKLLKLVGVGLEPSTTTTTTPSHGHNHRRKRSIEEETILLDIANVEESQTRSNRGRRAISGLATTCYTPESLLKIYGIDQATGLNASQFTELCPAIVQQIESGACKTITATTSSTSKQSEGGWKPWVSALVAVLIISIGSVAGIAAAPLNNKRHFDLLLMFLISLAMATLLGDALLHLLPHSLGLHKHEDAADGTHIEPSPFASDSFIWKCLCVIAGVYVFYVFEVLMHTCAPKHTHSHGLDDTHQHIARVPSHRKVSGPMELASKARRDSRSMSFVNSPAGIHVCDSEQDLEKEHDGNKVIHGARPYDMPGEQEQKSSFTKAISKLGQFKSIVYMVLIGDAVHNFMDGVVIGVAFSEKFPGGFSGGVSTSIAILSHEIPHELGDFAILVTSGLSIPMALCLNFLSSLTSFIGAIVGVSLGQQLDAAPWIFAVTAGLFAYIALVDLLPELLHSSELKRSPCVAFFLQTSGMFLGFGIMFLLAVYEEDIKFNL